MLVSILVISSVAVVTTGSVAHSVGDSIGVGNSAVQVWDIAKWPVLLLMVAFMITLMYWASPNLKHPSLMSVAPGALFAVGVWLIASLLFAAYVAGFSSYNKTYGSLGGCGRVPDLALDHEHRAVDRRGVQFRAGARATAGGAGGAVPYGSQRSPAGVTVSS